MVQNNPEVPVFEVPELCSSLEGIVSAADHTVSFLCLNSDSCSNILDAPLPPGDQYP